MALINTITISYYENEKQNFIYGVYQFRLDSEGKVQISYPNGWITFLKFPQNFPFSGFTHSNGKLLAFLICLGVVGFQIRNAVGQKVQEPVIFNKSQPVPAVSIFREDKLFRSSLPGTGKKVLLARKNIQIPLIEKNLNECENVSREETPTYIKHRQALYEALNWLSSEICKQNQKGPVSTITETKTFASLSTAVNENKMKSEKTVSLPSELGKKENKTAQTEKSTANKNPWFFGVGMAVGTELKCESVIVPFTPSTEGETVAQPESEISEKAKGKAPVLTDSVPGKSQLEQSAGLTNQPGTSRQVSVLYQGTQRRTKSELQGAKDLIQAHMEKLRDVTWVIKTKCPKDKQEQVCLRTCQTFVKNTQPFLSWLERYFTYSFRKPLLDRGFVGLKTTDFGSIPICGVTQTGAETPFTERDLLDLTGDKNLVRILTKTATTFRDVRNFHQQAQLEKCSPNADVLMQHADCLSESFSEFVSSHYKFFKKHYELPVQETAFQGESSSMKASHLTTGPSASEKPPAEMTPIGVKTEMIPQDRFTENLQKAQNVLEKRQLIFSAKPHFTFVKFQGYYPLFRKLPVYAVSGFNSSTRRVDTGIGLVKTNITRQNPIGWIVSGHIGGSFDFPCKNWRGAASVFVGGGVTF